MKVLWLANVPLPEASVLMGEKHTPFGGWLINSSNDLAENISGELAIAFPQNGTNGYECLQGKKIIYYPFPMIGNDREEIKYNLHLKRILEDFAPDIVHIYGTELSHSLAMINLCNILSIKFVVSIQGLISQCAKYYIGNLPKYVQNRFTFRDFIKMDNIRQQKRKFAKRGRWEIEALSKCSHVIGRTTWDKTCLYQINPQAKYHFCNETLREEFYKHKWSVDKCEKRSIFISQASYPLKGAHYMLEAMQYILREFTDAKLYIAGYTYLSAKTIKDKLKISSYCKYLRNLIKKHKLENHVVVTGVLDEQQMCQRYLDSNVFVSPSTIENSSNSLGEAMMLGVPSVASYVGGTPDMLKTKEEGFLYNVDDSIMLAHYICEIFKNSSLAVEFSQKSKEHASISHNKKENTKNLIRIYLDICS